MSRCPEPCLCGAWDCKRCFPYAEEYEKDTNEKDDDYEDEDTEDYE